MDRQGVRADFPLRSLSWAQARGERPDAGGRDQVIPAGRLVLLTRPACRTGLRPGLLVVTLCLAFSGLPAPAESQEQQPERYRAVPELSVGDVDGPLALTRVESIIVVGSRVLVSQPSEWVIRVFDAESGELITEWGSTGDGPGEMRDLSSMAVVGSSVVVVDRRLNRVTTFTPDGGMVESERFQFPDPSPPFVFGGIVLPTSDGHLVGIGDVLTSQGVDVPEHVPLRLFDVDGRVIDTLPAWAPRDRSVVLRREGVVVGAHSRPLHRGDRFALSVDGSRFIQARDRSGTGLSLVIYHIEDRRTEEVDLGVPPVTVPQDEADRMVERLRDALGGRGLAQGISRTDLDRALAAPPWIPAVDEMFVTATGETWLREPAFGTATHLWRVVGRDGSISATVEVPRGIVLRDRDGDHVWGFRVEPTFGVTTVERLRLEPLSENQR